MGAGYTEELNHTLAMACWPLGMIIENDRHTYRHRLYLRNNLGVGNGMLAAWHDC